MMEELTAFALPATKLSGLCQEVRLKDVLYIYEKLKLHLEGSSLRIVDLFEKKGIDAFDATFAKAVAKNTASLQDIESMMAQMLQIKYPSIVGDYSIVSAEDISIGAWLDHQCGIAPENATFADVHQENWPRIPAEKYISEASSIEASQYSVVRIYFREFNVVE